MVKHIVMWNFKESVKEEEKETIKSNMKKNLEGLLGDIPGLLEISFVKTPLDGSSHEIALVTEFDNEESKKGYGVHPSHVKIANTFVRPYTTNRACLDYQA
ncbi:MAG: Dabb family protein [Spirochaetaceae bacterium]|nr:Dabb family protein [Spirochaetaceae bacterium]